MITKLSVSNFRSLKDVELPLSKINVLTGSNNSGKSSVIYAILTLMNFVRNPNQGLDSLFNYRFINLGKFKNVIYSKDSHKTLGIEITTTSNNISTNYGIKLNEKYGNAVHLNMSNFEELSQTIVFPYDLELEKYNIPNNKGEDNYLSIFWNGITVQDLKIKNLDKVNDFFKTQDDKDFLESYLLAAYNTPFNNLIQTDFVPIARGFSKPYYSAIPLSGYHVTEDEIATIIVTSNIASDISYYLEKIIDKNFNIHQEVGTSVFYLQIRDRDTSTTNYLVNEGTGVSQLVTILAKALMEKNKFICIDEPEIHLHPSIITKLVSTLIEIADKKQKQFLVSTHSEQFVIALMHQVADKKIEPADVNVFYLDKDGNETKIEQQKINKKGQIDGGLMNFYGEELKDLEDFFQNN